MIKAHVLCQIAIAHDIFLLFFALKAKAIKLVPLEIAGLAMWLSYLLL
jgi:hypothetical protein